MVAKAEPVIPDVMENVSRRRLLPHKEVAAVMDTDVHVVEGDGTSTCGRCRLCNVLADLGAVV